MLFIILRLFGTLQKNLNTKVEPGGTYKQFQHLFQVYLAYTTRNSLKEKKKYLNISLIEVLLAEMSYILHLFINHLLRVSIIHYVPLRVPLCVCTCVYICVYTCVFVCVCTCAHVITSGHSV